LRRSLRDTAITWVLVFVLNFENHQINYPE
jgi:hypothetical protein